MKYIIDWLNNYEAEYNIHTQILYIYKAMPVKEFTYLKRLLIPYMYKVKDIIIEGRN